MEKIDEIQKLSNLLKEGALSQADFDLLKKNIIDNKSNSQNGKTIPHETNKPTKRLKTSAKWFIIIFIGMGLCALLGLWIINFKGVKYILNNEKKQLQSGDYWQISDSMSLNKNDANIILAFRNDSVIASNWSMSYRIGWMDKQTFCQIFKGDSMIVKLQKINSDIIKAAFVTTISKAPKSESYWIKMGNLGKVKYFIKMDMPISESSNESHYSVAGKQMSSKILPPAGEYYENERGFGVEIIVTDKKMLINLLDDVGTKTPVELITVSEDGEIQGQYSRSFKYIGNEEVQVIESGIKTIYKLYKKQNGANAYESLLSGMIEKGNSKTDFQEMGVVYDDDGDKKLGEIRKITFLLTPSIDLVKEINVPNGKIWILLYYEAVTTSSDCLYFDLPYIATRKASQNSWYKNQGAFDIPKKKDFVSYKAALQNNSSIAGRAAIIAGYCGSGITYTFYFLEK